MISNADKHEVLECINLRIEETQRAIDEMFDQAVCFSQQAGLKALVKERKELENLRARVQNGLK